MWAETAARVRRHPLLAAAALYAALSALMFAQALQPGHALGASDLLWSVAPWTADPPAGVRLPGSNPELSDSVQVFQPFLAHTRATLPDLPLWNPHISAGRPFLANQQSAVFSPFSLPAYLLAFWWSFGLIAALKTFVSAFGAFLLGRALGMRDAGALLTGLVYGFSLFLLAWITWPLTNVWPLIPWLWLLTEVLVRRPGPLPAIGLAGLVGVQYFGGHPESSFHALAATVGFLGLRLAVHRGAAAIRPALLWFAAAVVAGTALAAVTLVPLLELIAHSGDLAQRQELPPSVVRAKYGLALLLPEYWGRPTGTPLEGFLIERAFYLGALPLVLAGAALALRPTLERVGVAVLGGLALALVFGAPLVAPAIRLLPGFSEAHNTRLTIVFVLCAALLAGWGLDELLRRERPAPARLRLVALWTAGLVALPVAVMAARGEVVPRLLGRGLDAAWGFATPPAPPVSADGLATIRLGTLIVWLTFAAGAAALVGLRARGRLGAGTFAALALALVAADLFRAGMGQTPALTLAEARQPATGAIRHLQSRRPARFVGLNSPRGPGAIQANLAMRWGLYDARGYDFPVERRYRRLWRRAVARGMPPLIEPTQLALASPRSLRALGLLSVSDVLQDPRDPPLSLPGLRLAYAGRDGRVYENRRALPRAFLVGGQQVVPGEARQLAAILDPGFDGRREAVVSRPLAGLARGAAPAPGRARIVRYEDERVVVRVDAVRAGALVLTDVFFPGWRAEVDGERAPIHRVDYLLRGVAVPPGRHTVEMRYEPASFRWGAAISLLAAAGLALGGLAALHARRRARRWPDPPH